MDVIRFEIGEREDPAGGLVEAVEVFVNDRNLVDILREIELPFAARDGKPDFAGRYVGLPPDEVYPPSSRLLGDLAPTMTTTISRARSPSSAASAAT